MSPSPDSWITDALTDVRNVLRSAAKSGRVLTYADLAREASISIELGPRSPELAKLLCELLIEDASNERPLLTSLVINRNTGRPGKGFFRLARHYYRFRDDEEFWLEELRSLYDYYGVSEPRLIKRSRSAITSVDPRASTESHILSFFD